MLSERYDNLELIGEGVSARVYKAVDIRTRSVVAIKVLSPHLQTDEISLERFRREIQITRFLGHPQIVSIYDLVTENDQTYLVMEYIEGHNLKEFIKRQAPVDIDTVLSIVRQTLDILALCHAKNVIHRDLKPQNIILTADGLVKLLDFGISRMTTLSDLTHTGTSLGSPEYMAPELFAANTYDRRTDLYALGVITFELLAGELPFKGDSLPVLFNQHRTAPVPALRDSRHDVPEWVQQLTEKLLAKKGYERYQSADEALADIAHCRVISKHVPSLEKRECVQCGAATIADLPLCTFCGYDAAHCLRPGSYDVCCFETHDTDTVTPYFQSVFNVRTPANRRRGPLLIAGIDRFSAEVVRKSALTHGLVLTVKKHSAFGVVKKVGALCLSAVFGFNGLKGWLFDSSDVGVFLPHPEQLFLFRLVQSGTLLLVSWISFNVARREVVRPLLARKTLITQVAAEFGWVKELIAAKAAGDSDPLQLFLSQLIEKYLLLLKAGMQMDAALKQALQQVMRGAARVVGLVAEIERTLSAAPLLQQANEYAAVTQQLHAEADTDRTRQLRQRRATLAAALEQSSALEDQYSALMNKLIHLQSVFNTLVGKALVFRNAFDASDVDLLEGCLHSLREDVTIAREVDAELSRVA